MFHNMSKYCFSLILLASVLVSSPMLAQETKYSAFISHTLMGERALFSETTIVESPFFDCSQNEVEKRYCVDELTYYQRPFFGELQLMDSKHVYTLQTEFDLIAWSQLQLNLRKDLMQIAEVSASGHSFDVQVQLAKAKTQENRNLVDKNLVIFLNKYRTHSQTQRWLPASQYHLQQPSVLAEIGHDSKWITLVITRFFPPKKNEK
ncbi:hypothetical protein [Vibrio navarrensis]|uniref:hypothetical protein n=1 Tax=Vibrio navarrensis TaxID=29495 RepID=UPI0029C04E1F|nr:hypothetical protein [Vibrio navarrensis]